MRACLRTYMLTRLHALTCTYMHLHALTLTIRTTEASRQNNIAAVIAGGGTHEMNGVGGWM